MLTKSQRAQKGASIIHWVIALAALLAFGALAIDLNRVYVASAELQRAADAGALAGANALFTQVDDDLLLNTNVGLCNGTADSPCTCDADDPACVVAWENASQWENVEVVSTKRGHWQFLPDGHAGAIDTNLIEHGGRFYANNSATTDVYNSSSGAFRDVINPGLGNIVNPLDASPCSSDRNTYLATRDLNNDPCDVNAVEVVVQRKVTPIASTFANILGIPGFSSTARAVAYIGWQGSSRPWEDFDVPIALCEHLLIDSTGSYNCHLARWSPSSEADEGAARWTDFSQNASGSCPGASDANVLGCLVDEMTCSVGGGMSDPESCYGNKPLPPDLLQYQSNMSVLGTGVAQSAVSALFDKWNDCAVSTTCTDPATGTEVDSGFPTEPYTLRMPVVDCNSPSSTTEACEPLFGGVEVQLIWMNNQQSDSGIPSCMKNVEGWEGNDWHPDAPASKNRWGNDVIPTSQAACLPALGYQWNTQHGGECLDTNVYSINGVVIYNGTNKKYDREKQVWDSFVKHFRLSAGNDATPCEQPGDNCAWQAPQSSDSGYRDKTLYFSPSCKGLEGGGGGGTVPFVRAKYPYLVD